MNKKATVQMSLFIEPEKKFDIQYLSPSSLDCFSRCPAKFCFAKLMRLERQGTNKTPLIFGKCIHAAIYAAYDNPSLAFEIFCKYWDEEGGSHIQDDARNENHARLIFETFHSFHKSS